MWKLVIGGVDHTSLVRRAGRFQAPTFENERRVRGLLEFDIEASPDKYVDVVAYAKDGVTKVFGGLLTRREPIEVPAGAPFCTRCECTDYLIYTDWCYWTKQYTTDQTLLQVLTDLVTEKLAAYGLSLDPTQPVGPTLSAPFGWTRRRVWDVLLDLSLATGYDPAADPDRVVSMRLPGSLAAPVALTEAARNLSRLTYTDPSAVPANTIIGVFGPSGTGADPVTYTWTAQAGVYTYSLAGVAVPTSKVWPGLITISAADLVTNGGFASDLSGWTAGANWSWSGGLAAHTAGSDETLAQTITCGVGWHRIFFTANLTAGSVAVTFGGLPVPNSGTDIYVDIPPCDLVITPSSDCVGTIDDVIVVPLLTYPMWPAGMAPGGEGIEWDEATDDGTLSFLGAAAQALITGGELIILTYYPQFPFTIEATTGATPRIEQPLVQESVTDYALAQAMVAQALAQSDPTARVFTVDTLEDGFAPLQAASFDAPSRNASGISAIVTRVRGTLTTDDYWAYVINADETVLQPDFVSKYRTLVGRSGGTVSAIALGGPISVAEGGGDLATALRVAAWGGL